MGYKSGLPNFMCIEVTDRSIDPAARGLWRHKDTITEILRYRDKSESRSVMEVDGKPADSMNAEDIKGTQSTGEFGGVLDAVFEPSAKADFQWKETDTLGNGTVQVFDYHVAKENSSFSVRGSNGLEPTAELSRQGVHRHRYPQRSPHLTDCGRFSKGLSDPRQHSFSGLRLCIHQLP